MYSIFIDASSSLFVVIILKDRKLIGSSITPTKNNLTDLAVVEISRLLKASNLGFADISEILAINGPGSFTGIRVAMTITRTLKVLFPKITVKTMSSLEFLGLNQTCLSLIDARGGMCYAQIFKPESQPKVSLIKYGEAIKYAQENGITLLQTSYENIDFETRLSDVIDSFKECKNLDEVVSNYIKPSVS